MICKRPEVQLIKRLHIPSRRISNFRTKSDMTDILSEKERSILMSKVRSADTKPEWILRCGLHRLGFRYRLKNKHLPGCPDLVFPKYRAALFVHGCYWHRHPGCKDASTPKTNVEFWKKKFTDNEERDQRNERQLVERGYRVLVVWECELINHTKETLDRAAHWLCQEDLSKNALSYDRSNMDRQKLLEVAEKKIRYRIDAYDKSRD